MLIFKIIARALLTLSLMAGLVFLLLPLGILQRAGIFVGKLDTPLWLLFALGLAFGIVLYSLGAETIRRRNLSKTGGGIFMVLGFVSAMEIFLIQAHPLGAPGTTPLWWLFVTWTVLGAIGIYAPERAERMERKAKEEEHLAEEEAKRPALERGRRSNLRIVSYVVRP